MQNPMQIMQLIQTLRNSGNPEQMMMQMFGGNPQTQQIMNMARNASPQQLENLVRQTCQQRGIDFNQLMSMIGIPK